MFYREIIRHFGKYNDKLSFHHLEIIEKAPMDVVQQDQLALLLKLNKNEYQMVLDAIVGVMTKIVNVRIDVSATG